MGRMIQPRAIPAPVVVSVPHSGTRTLVKHLGLDTHQHFDYKQPMAHPDPSVVHIPIRYPMAVAESWARRDKDVDQLLKRYDCMFTYLDRHRTRGGLQPHMYKVEDLPRLAGFDDEGVDRGSHYWDTQQRISEYMATVMEDVVIPHESFFLQYYEHVAPG